MAAIAGGTIYQRKLSNNRTIPGNTDKYSDELKV